MLEKSGGCLCGWAVDPSGRVQDMLSPLEGILPLPAVRLLGRHPAAQQRPRHSHLQRLQNRPHTCTRLLQAPASFTRPLLGSLHASGGGWLSGLLLQWWICALDPERRRGPVVLASYWWRRSLAALDFHWQLLLVAHNSHWWLFCFRCPYW